MYFPSKKDIWLFPFYWGSIIVCFIPLFIQRDYWALLLTIPFAILLIWIWFTTGYTVNDEQLIINGGPFKVKIPIQDIRKISQTKNLLSSLALSIDRLEISYGSDFSMALISPKDKHEFISSLKTINPQIDTDHLGNSIS